MQSKQFAPVFIACLLSGTSLAAVATPALAQAPQTGADTGVPVVVAKPVRQDVPVFLDGLGTVAANYTVLVRSRVDGTLDSVGFTEGDTVKAGTVLATIDPRPYQATLDQAIAKRASDVANLANARLDLNRYNRLAHDQFAAQQQVDTQVSTVSQLEATIKGDDATIAAAKLNLDFTRITAPFEGRVGLRLVDPGNFIHATDATGIVTLSQIKPIAVTFTLPQDSLPEVASAMAKNAKPAVLAWSADNKTKLSDGTLLTVDNTIDASTGTIKVKAMFPNLEDKLWPGQFVNAKLLIKTLPNSVTVPSAAIQHGENGLFLFIVQPDQTVQAKPIDVLLDNGTVAVISKGLSEGDTFVLNGQSRLANGMHVAPTTAPAS